MRIARMLGYMTKRDALENGFTHHGAYFGTPCWIAPDDGFMVATKWAPFEYLMTAMHYVEGFIRSIRFPDDEPTFQFALGAEIKAD